jgi:hypothetical protein
MVSFVFNDIDKRLYENMSTDTDNHENSENTV